MARIEGGEGDKGREREWLARAVRAPRDRAWIADGYVSDRWLPVSPVTGAVDAFEWKAPVDAIGRGDETLLIDERMEPPRDASAMVPPAGAMVPPPETVSEPAVVVDVTPTVHEEPDEDAAPPVETTVSPVEAVAQKPAPPVFVPSRPPDDPGVSQAEADESPTSLERLRAAQIR